VKSTFQDAVSGGGLLLLCCDAGQVCQSPLHPEG
jgi:hypothetical protein